MFQPMIEKIMNNDPKDSISLEKRIEIFNVFEDNFHDLFNSRSIFDALDNAIRQLPIEKETRKRSLLKLLQKTAKEISQQEELLISGYESENENILSNITFDSLQTGTYIDSAIKMRDGRNTENHKFTLRLDSIDTMMKLVKIRLKFLYDKDSIVLNNGEPFDLEYYDTPFTDNIMLKDHHRVCIVLKKIYSQVSTSSVKMAKLKILHFPANLITTGYRPSIPGIDDMLNKNNK